MSFISVLFCVLVIFVLLKMGFKNGNLASKIKGPTGSFIMVFMTRVQTFSYFRSCAQQFKGVYRFFGFGNIYVFVTRAREAEILLSSSAHSRKTYIYKIMRRFFGQSTFTSNGEQWKKQRKMLTPTLHFEILSSFSNIIVEESAKGIERLQRELENKNKVRDVGEFVANYTLAATYRSFMGMDFVDESGAKEFLENIPKLEDLYAERLTRPPLHNDLLHEVVLDRYEKRLLEPVQRFTRNTIKKRREEWITSGDYNSVTQIKKRHALLDTLLINEVNGNIDSEVVQNEVDLFLWASHLTSALTISFVLMLLANHPEIQQRVFEEIVQVVNNNNSGQPRTASQLGDLNFLDRVIKEALRLYPPVPTISRQLTESMFLEDGTEIPAGKPVFLQIFDLHRDKDVFTDPEKFDPDRFLPENCATRSPFAYVPFSAGPRNCIGKKFALTMIKTFVKDIVLHYNLICVTKQTDIQFTSSNVLRTIDPILVGFECRDNRNHRHHGIPEIFDEGKSELLLNKEIITGKESRSR